MAGSYPDVPAPRMAWDRDGSVGFTITGAGTLSQLTQAQMQEFNDEDNVNVYQIDGWNEIGAGSGDVDLSLIHI